MGTINELNTTDTLADDDKLVIWKDQAGATRAITAEDAATYFSLAGGPYQPLDELLTAIAGLGPSTAAGDFIELTAQDTVRVRKLTVATYAALTVIPASFRFDDMLVYVASRATDGERERESVIKCRRSLAARASLRTRGRCAAIVRAAGWAELSAPGPGAILDLKQGQRAPARAIHRSSRHLARPRRFVVPPHSQCAPPSPPSHPAASNSDLTACTHVGRASAMPGDAAASSVLTHLTSSTRALGEC